MQTLPPLDLGEMPEPPQSIRAKTRDAIHAMVMESLTGAEAARRAGLGPNTLSKAMQRPDVQAFVKELTAFKIRRDQIKREGYVPLILDEALKLAQHAKAESIRLRAIEFLYGALGPKDAAGKPVPVAAAQINIGPGYHYQPPADGPSRMDDAQAIEHKGKAVDDD